ncbi:hypothetical protein TPR58_16240 [Sphingomonas sp. HF-S3]|jgi:hypothetical protein|uniref:Uncharacterized protein n=1 Tax=Sphingomonas rustica TaxID=3103142 RepID=A0ABV0BCX6_9SPHN
MPLLLLAALVFGAMVTFGAVLHRRRTERLSRCRKAASRTRIAFPWHRP